MRGNSEDNLIPKRGEHGDHFWRRFSMVAKTEKKPRSTISFLFSVGRSFSLL